MRAPDGSLLIESDPVTATSRSSMYCDVCTLAVDCQRNHARFGLADLHLEHVRASRQPHRRRRHAAFLAVDDYARAWRTRLHGELAFTFAYAAAAARHP